jgi:hypothetical protein
MQSVLLTRTSILPLNAYNRQELNQKSPDAYILVNMERLRDQVDMHSHFPEYTPHGQCAPMEERLSANNFRQQRQLHNERQLTYEKFSVGEAHVG